MCSVKNSKTTKAGALKRKAERVEIQPTGKQGPTPPKQQCISGSDSNNKENQSPPTMPQGIRLPNSVENALVVKFQEHGERMLTEEESEKLAKSIAVSAEDEKAILQWLQHWIPKMVARKIEKSPTPPQPIVSEKQSPILINQCNNKKKPKTKKTRKESRTPPATEIALPSHISARGSKLATVFGSDEPVDLPENLSLNLEKWTVEDVLRFVDHVITPLDNFCSLYDKGVIRERKIDGTVLYDIAVDNQYLIEGYGLTPRTFVSLKFRSRHILNTLWGH